MSHIVFAHPEISRFHLCERLRRELARRGHEVSLLCADASAATFWDAQSHRVHRLPPPRRRRGHGRGDLLLASASRWLQGARPDLVLFVDRHPAHAAVRAAADAAGCRSLWAGDGLLPHTLQVDPRGLDADASSQRWSPRDFRVVTPDPAMLEASLAHALAGSEPLGLPRTGVQAPPVGSRLRDAARAALGGDAGGAWRAWTAWRGAREGARAPAWDGRARAALEQPSLAVLLQASHDPRTPHGGPRTALTRALLERAQVAARARNVGVVAVLPADAHEAPWRRLLSRPEHAAVRALPPEAAAVAAATATAVLTANHPAATVALLAGTPVVHTNGALYQLEGVTRRADAAAAAAAVEAAASQDRPALRRRFLTWLLRYGHVWCSPTAPTYNGLLGLAERIERAAHAAEDAARAGYRPGPCWPLAAPV